MRLPKVSNGNRTVVLQLKKRHPVCTWSVPLAASPTPRHLRDYPFFEHYAGAYNAGNQVEVQKRAIALTDPALLAEYGDGWWPLRWVYEKGEE